MIIEPARRTTGVQEYYFSRKQKDLDAVSARLRAEGDSLINLGIGAPDGMPPQAAIDALRQQLRVTTPTRTTRVSRRSGRRSPAGTPVSTE